MISVLVVDDSPVIRQVFMRVLSSDPEISEVRTAGDPYVARDLIAQRVPDVITLDVEMPRLDGISFLKKLMAHHPIPVVMISSLTGPNTQTSIEALQNGAVDVLLKPTRLQDANQLAEDLRRAVKNAAQVDVRRHVTAGKATIAACAPGPGGRWDDVVIAIGASTGGTVAVESILRAFPKTIPGTVVVQHMPAFVTAAFAARLNSVCNVEVAEAASGMVLRPGLVLVAPGDKHTMLQREGGIYTVSVVQAPRVNHHRPSIDVLLSSVAKVAGARAIGAVLTGMGGDGANGLLEMRKNGARTMAQDEASCVVFGIPKVAIASGAAEEVVRLSDIPARICRHLTAMGNRQR